MSEPTPLKPEEEVLVLRSALLLLLDNVDYTQYKCGMADRVGAVLPPEVIVYARRALSRTGGKS